MALPMSYSEDTFAEYLHSQLYGVAGALGWTVDGDSYAEIVNDTLVAYGESDITAITGEPAIIRLRTIGKYQVWRAAVDALSAKYDYATDNQSFHLSQMQGMANDALRQATQAASIYGVGGYAVQVQRVVRVQDPYNYVDPTLQVTP